MKRLFAALAGIFLLAGIADAAAVLRTVVPWQDGTGRRHYIYTIDVTSASNGAASVAWVMHGYINRVATDPGATAPSDNWGFVLTDESGADVCGGAVSGNRDTSTSEQALCLVNGDAAYPRVDGTITATFAAMGDSKVATIRIYVSE